MATALSSTEAGNIIADCVLRLIGNSVNSYVLGFAVFAAAFMTTSLIYNRAVGKILVPVVLAIATSLQCDPRGLIQMCYIGSMCSTLTPMATSLVPMVMQNGGYTQKDLIKQGWLSSLLLCLTTVGVGMTIYPCF